MQEDLHEELKSRPDWDTYYLAMAFVVAQRSFDPSTKCGCVIVSKDGRVLTTGYNGPIKKSNDENIPLTRPEKYAHMIHSEENALLAYSGSHQDIQGATAYITGRPCHRCLRGLLQKGITKFVCGLNATKVVDQADMSAQEIMLRDRPHVTIKELDTNDAIFALFDRTKEYMKMKESQPKNY